MSDQKPIGPADRIIEGAREALSVAKGEQPAASITVNGHKYVPASRISQQDAELERLKAVIAWANNSLFGSHGFFLSLDGGEPDEHHLDRAIEALKEGNRKARLQGIEDTLGALTAHELYQYRPKAFEGFIAYARTTLMGEAGR